MGRDHTCFIDASDIHAYTKHVSPALSTTSTLWCIELDDNMTELYPRLPHMTLCGVVNHDNKGVLLVQKVLYLSDKHLVAS